MEKVNVYDIELAIDARRAQTGKEKEINIWQENIMQYEYGTQKFHSKEALFSWLKNQKPNHEAIANFIETTRQKYPNSGLESIFQTYEQYYGNINIAKQKAQTNLDTLNKTTQNTITVTPVEAKPIVVDKTNENTPYISDKNHDIQDPEHYSERIAMAEKNLREMGKTIQDLQIALRDQGYLVKTDEYIPGTNMHPKGEITGIYDAETDYAVGIFKTGVDGIKNDLFPDKATLEKIFSGKYISVDMSAKNDTTKTDTQNTIPTTTEKYEITEWRGSFEDVRRVSIGTLKIVGKDFTDVQKVLREKGFYNGENTGIYDEKTYESVKNFQKTLPDLKYGADGKIEGITLKGLFGEKILDVPLLRKDDTTTTTTTTTTKNPEKVREYTLDDYKNYAEKELKKIGKDVASLQIWLIKKDATDMAVSGIFDQKTLDAIRKFQEMNNIRKDGFAGPETLSKLFDTTNTPTPTKKFDDKVVNPDLSKITKTTTTTTTETPKPKNTDPGTVVFESR